MVLYRKYRPQKFIDIVGQDHIKKTLTNSLITGNFAHGYLFSGPRGSGKTTIARIFAKALNCTGRKLGKNSFEPCGKCPNCLEIAEGKSLDIIEIDAASNRGIDEIRELREKIRFAPTKSTYKVYIIDEVHMLTKEAFNALLKTLEEPPKHAIFVMATTEPQKVLPTIVSRVQRFDFHKATIEEIELLLERVVAAEKFKTEKEALTLLAQLSFGAYRDSLSLLDQVSASMAQENITVEKVQDILGLGSDQSVFDFLLLLAKKDRQKLFELISNLYFQGIDFEHFITKLVEIFRKITLFKLGENQLFDLTKEQQQKVAELASLFEVEDLMKMLEKFISIIPKIKSANLPQLPLEMIVFELTKDNLQPTANNLQPKKMAPEKEKVVDNSSKAPEVEAKVPEEKIAQETPSVPEKAKVQPGTAFDANLWPQVVKETKVHNNPLAAMLRDAAISGTDGEHITLAFKFKFHADSIGKKQNALIIENIIEKVCGCRYILTCIVDPNLAIKKPVDKEEALIEDISEVFGLE